MPTYAIGDIQGCWDELQGLLGRIAFDAARDRLWLVGDLVNRGPRSLEVLRWAMGLGDRVVTVLGNHDLHLLSCRYGLRQPKPSDTFQDVLAAPDADTLLDWLERRPFIHREGERILVHAGLVPSWTAEEAVARGDELAAALQADPRGTLTAIGSREEGPPRWNESLTGSDRLRALAVIFTRLRMCSPDGTWSSFDGPPEGAPFGLVPWFDLPDRRTASSTVIFGHWSALDLHRAPGLLGLDTGCVWGRHLTAIRLEDGALLQVDSRKPL